MDSAQEEKHVADKMTENSWSSGEHFQIRHEDEEFGVYPAGLGIWSSIFSLCSIFPFQNVIYILRHYMLEVCDFTFHCDFKGDYSPEIVLHLRSVFELWAFQYC